MDKIETKIQKALNKLVAEEFIAAELYTSSILAADQTIKSEFSDIFSQISKDEKLDHYVRLIDFALTNDYSIPVNFKEYEKYADPKLMKLYNSLKHGMDTKYYIYIAVKSEELAIESYTEFLNDMDLPYDFSSILWQIKYEEDEHYTKLVILSDALKSGATLNCY